jgi:hypothetical protein
MTERIKLVRGDTAPQIRLTLTDEVSNTPINLIGTTVTLHFRAVGADTVLFSRPAFINQDLAPSGVCVISWEDDDLDVEAGDYEGEVEIVRATGARETIYDILKFRVREQFA